MDQKAQFIGFTSEELRYFIRTVVCDCLREFGLPEKARPEAPMSIQEACRLLGVSAPTLKKFVDQSLIRRHDLGGRKKVFYRSELEEDIKHLTTPNRPSSPL